MNFTAVILAGGKSSRMGRDKAWLTFEGEPLIHRSLDLVRGAGASEVLISGRAGLDFSALGCPVLLDTVSDCGPLGGIERALSVAKHSVVLVLAVDLPHMTPPCLQWLYGEVENAMKRVPTGGLTMGVVPMLRNRLEPLAAFYPTQANKIVRHMLGEKHFAARHFAEACLRQGIACAAPVPKAHERCFSNWNTPSDTGLN